MAILERRFFRLILYCFLSANLIFLNSLRTQGQVVASFSANPTSGCVPLTVNFFDNSTNATAYYWDFGNGNTSTLQNPSTVYLNSGFYTVTLVAINTMNGQRDTFTAQNYIHAVPAPNTLFTATPLAACINNHTVSFTNSTTGAISYIWDFGDGNSSTAVNPTHVYQNSGTYTVKLIATNGFGCSTIQTRSNYITIHPKPSVNFTVNFTSSCNANDVFQFTATGSGVSSWQWNFGDGNTSTQQNPSHVYGSTGSYTVTLIATNNNGCKDTVIKPAYINIGNSLVPSFTATNLTGCNTLTTVFTALVQNAITWQWNFGDGSPVSTLPNPSHTYSAPGNYTITLTVTTSNGCNGTASYPNGIVVDPLPVANFTVSQPDPCSYFTFQFNNTSTNATTYLWNFGDGTTSTLANPQHIYAAAGSYHVTLTAVSPNGCTASTTINSAVVIPVRVPNFNAAPRAGCSPLPVTFTPNNYPGAIAWNWDFGDGNTSNLQFPTNTYINLGYYSIKLKITTNQGCIDSVRRANYVRVVNGQVNYILPDTIIGCAPYPVSFTNPLPGCDTTMWSFGNGDSAFTPNTSYLYTVPGTYIVSFYGSMPDRCRQYINPFAIVKIYEFIPEPILTLSSTPCKPFQFHFDNLTPDIVSYVWNFGDGSPVDTVKSPVHVFAQSGTYTVTLTLTNIYGCVKTVTITVTVGIPNPIQVLNNTNCVNTPVQFNINNPSQFSSYTWNFGDGSPASSLQNPSHTYTSPGSYVVSLIATSTAGCTDTFYTSPLGMYLVTTGFTATPPLSGCDSLTVQFNNTSTGAGSYLWNFGNGVTATDTNPVYTYTVPGIYSVTLTATNGNCSKTVTQNNLITIGNATADFSFTSSGPCFPISVSYTDLSTNAVSWLWNFGDGNTSTQQHPSHLFTYQPSGPVTLTITDVNGCVKTISKPNVTGVNVTASVADTLGCRPFTTSFQNNSPGATSWLWNFGDGNTSTQQNPTHTYTTAGVYTVTLTVTLGNCTSTITLPERVHVVRPIPDFNSPTVAVCAPSLVQFNDLSTGAIQWLWDFGDGTSSTVQNPSHIYSIPGSYTVSLRIWDSLGCTAIKVRNNYINVPGTYAYFTLISNTSCLNTFVQFSDSSVNALTWLWNFGDGYTSTQQNPSHNYLDTGSYIVSLITTDSLGCTSYFTYPDPIVVYPVPSAQGIATSALSGCTPLQVSFQNQSYAYSSLTWHFGNGDSSNANNPSYTYNSYGIYPVTLVAYNQYGCSDTALVATVDALMTPVAQFSPVPSVGCTPMNLQVNNQSTLLQNPVYAWQFGNGQNSTAASPGTVYPDPGTYTIHLTITNDNGCSNSASASVVVHLSPTAAATLSDTAGCQPLSITFGNNSLNADSYVWHFGDGNSTNGITASHTYTQNGIFTPYLVAISNNGCTDTSYLPSVNVKLTPVASFIADSRGLCPLTQVALTSTSSGISNPVYQWTLGNLISNQPEPSFTLSNPGFYNVSLTITNDNGCYDTHTEVDFIEVYDTVPPPVTPILSVSVLSNTSVEVKWMPSQAFDLYEYRLFRYNQSTTGYDLIYTLVDTNNANPNVNLVYVDNGLNTLNNVYTYKVQTVDRCQYKLPLSQSLAHTTINVTAQTQGTNIKVTWTPYGGCPVSVYEINRIEVPSGISQFVGSVNGNSQLTFTDTTLSCPFPYSYRITARDLCGNPYHSLSDTAVATPVNSLAGQKVEVVRSTVIFNKNVLTEWTAPNMAPDRVQKYNVLRSTDNFNFTVIASVPAGNYSYIDNTVNVNSNHYYYKVDVINDCNISGAISNEGSSILLKSDWNQEKTKLDWSEYEKWDTGVDYYIIEKRNSDGQWIQIKMVDGSETETVIDE